MTVDFGDLNNITPKWEFPMPHPDATTDQFIGCQYWTALDLANAFYQIQVHDKHIPKLAFSTDDGHFEFTVMPFGVKNAPATFQYLMYRVLGEFYGKFVYVYLDDIIIFSRSLEEHVDHLRQVLTKIREANLKIKPSKCQWIKTTLRYLGYTISRDGVTTDPNNVAKLQNMRPPKNVKDIQSFLGFCNFYKKFIKDFATIAHLLNALLHKGTPFLWTNECQTAFETLRQAVISAPVLSYPDYSKPFILYTDASDYGIGAAIHQIGDDGKEHPISYAARTLRGSEVNWTTTEKECLAVVWGTLKFRHYLDNGLNFTIYTDHQALVTFKNDNTPNPRRARWRAELSYFDYTLKHRPGKQMAHVDFLSRQVIPTDGQVARTIDQMRIEFRPPITEQYFVAQINEASPVPFIHPKLKNEAASPIPIETYHNVEQETT